MHRSDLILTILFAPTLVVASRDFPVPDAPIPLLHRVWIAGMVAGLPASSQTVPSDPIAGVRQEFDTLLARTRDHAEILRWAATKLVKQREEIELLETLKHFGQSSGIQFGLLSRDTSYADALYSHMLTNIRQNDAWPEEDSIMVYRLARLFVPFVAENPNFLVITSLGKVTYKRDLPDPWQFIDQWWKKAKAKDDALKSEELEAKADN